MKRIVSVVLCVVVLMSCFAFSALADNETTILINGEKLVSDVPARTFPVYEYGRYVGERMMVPIRAICEKLNCDVYWNEETSGITIYRKQNLYIMWLGKETAFHMDGPAISGGYEMDITPAVVDNRTLVPLRAVGELLGAEVRWYAPTKTVEINYDLGELEDNSAIAEKYAVFEEVLQEKYDVYDYYLKGWIKRVNGKFVLENGDEISFEIYPKIAPETSNNFISLAKSGFYNNTIFHRVINGFVVQGGGFDVNEEYKMSDNVVGEFVANNYPNFISHTRGTISLARANDYNSGSSQFFIVQQDSKFLDSQYAAFGKITDGMDIVDKICNAETDENDKPLTPIVVKQVIIYE